MIRARIFAICCGYEDADDLVDTVIACDKREAFTQGSDRVAMTGLLPLPRLLAEAHFLGEL